MNPCRKNVSAAPAIVKIEKANGISQYLLRFRVLLVRTAIARKRAESPSRKAPWKIHRGINATPNRNDSLPLNRIRRVQRARSDSEIPFRPGRWRSQLFISRQAELMCGLLIPSHTVSQQ